jgi:hypothetical protein
MIFLTLLRLTPLEVVRDIPRDGSALVTYTLVVLFVAFVWYGNRRRSAPPVRDARSASPRAS